jgi:hypothetical protein
MSDKKRDYDKMEQTYKDALKATLLRVLEEDQTQGSTTESAHGGADYPASESLPPAQK